MNNICLGIVEPMLEIKTILSKLVTPLHQGNFSFEVRGLRNN